MKMPRVCHVYDSRYKHSPTEVAFYVSKDVVVAHFSRRLHELVGSLHKSDRFAKPC